MKMWPTTEKSTRNCYNALSTKRLVSCRVGTFKDTPLRDYKGRPLHETRITARGILFGCCKGCLKFDNDWDKKYKQEAQSK